MKNIFVRKMKTNKHNFLKNFKLIKKYKTKNNHILEKLKQANIHMNDRQIILDIYNFYKNEKIKFNFVTFDKDFYNSLQKCNFSFIEKIIGKKELQELFNKN